MAESDRESRTQTDVWSRVQALFRETLACAPAGRASFLDSACGGDVALRRQVEDLLASADATDGPLDRPAVVVGIDGASSRPGDDWVGRQIGRYVIRDVIASGGMGTVFRAEQENPRRSVALKVIRPGYVMPELLRRFEHEAAVLGRLQHPGIAQIFEAGTATIDGTLQPFFAMEFVDGRPLTDYARHHDLSTRDRLGLVVHVCAAVSHAHQKGVIHRDLKPGNILV